MYAIISEIDEESSEKVSQIWHHLCEMCGLEEIYTLPTPHFSWLVADGMILDLAKAKVASMISRVPEISTYTFGLGIFSGILPVLFLPMVKTMDMIQLHQEIWDQVGPHCSQVNMYYSPSLWMPHITLALKDLDKDKLACAVNVYAFKQIELSVTMTSIALAESVDKKIGNILHRFPVNK
jgi:2'-5' RNA ligase